MNRSPTASPERPPQRPDTELDPFHEGERYVQERTGERGTALRVGALLSRTIPPRGIEFLARQRMVAVGSVDGQGSPWASVLLGARGQVSSPNGSSVVIDRARVSASAYDPLWKNLRVGGALGMLAIDLESRRRLRINGSVSDVDEHRILVEVGEAFPNCPKYVQSRQLHDDPGPRPADSEPHAHGVSLDETRSLVVARSDTMFVASRHPTHGVDVSHRGGAPGFVRVLDPTRLRIPDYRGNGMFNTLGNFIVDDRAGLVFVDFERGRLLQMIGTAEVRFDQPEDPSQPTGASGRYWDFRVEHWQELPVVAGLGWELMEFSPYNPVPG